MSTSGSVSKGVFVFRGKKSKVKAEKYYPEGQSKYAQDRFSVCQKLWENVSEKIETLEENLNTKIFDELLQYIANAHKSFTLQKDENPYHQGLSREIPTAALVTGVNMPDHESLFSNLKSLISDQVSSHIVRLQSKDCPSLKNMMNKTVSQVMHNTDLLLEDEDETEGKNLKAGSCTLSTLSLWYADISKRQQMKSPTRKRKSSGSRLLSSQYPPIVIILEDLEGFQSKVVQDFVSICSNHMSELPIVLVFGIATTVTAVHKLMPHAVSSLLCMEKFQAPPPSEYLTQVLNEVFMTPCFPFKLGHKVFELLLDIFLYHDFSVVNFIRAYQFCLLEHFYNNQGSILCQTLKESQEQLKEMKPKDIEELRKYQSFKSYVEKQPSKERTAFVKDDAFTRSKLAQFLKDLDQYHEDFFSVMKCLHAFTCKLPRYPLGKQLREVYCTCLTSSVCDTQEYEGAVALLRNLSRDEIVIILKQCAEHLGGEKLSSDLKESFHFVSEHIEKFGNFEELSQIHESYKGCDVDVKSPEKLLPKKTDMYTLRQTLQEIEKKKKKLTVYEVLREEIVSHFDKIFRKHLKCPQSLPLYEVFYFSDSADIRHHINGSPRATIQTGLSNPYVYLQNKECIVDGGYISQSLPDICIVYKLHLECGRLINLYDWLQAFRTIIEGGSDDDFNKKPDKVLQARFIRAVSELQFLGFVKPTKRKTDHVARLTWGGC